MKMYLATAFALLCGAFSYGQTRCGQHVLEQELRQNPEIQASFEAYEQSLEVAQYSGVERAELKIIPVVFHVIHMNGEENISDEQIYDAMRIINEDYAALNEELDEVVSSFTGIIGTGDIEFRLARIDPDGFATNGIDRIQSNETFVGDDGSKLNPWPRSKYLNIWVTDVISIAGAAAYAYRPPAADVMPNVDGVIANHRYVGSIGTASSGSGSKTLTHEIGHYLGLAHTWGPTNEPGVSSNCSEDDGIADTPNCLGVSNGGCNLSMTTCGSLDNVQNFMDYANCEAMFTKGQISVMRTTLASSLAQRSSLVTASNLEATGVADLSEAMMYLPNRAVCVGHELQVFDASAYGPESWSWTVTGAGDTYTSSDRNPVFVFQRGGVYDITLEVSQGNITKSITQSKAIAVAADYGVGVPYSEDFSQTPEMWVIDNHDEENDIQTWVYSTSVGNGDSRCFKMNSLGAPPNRIDDLIFASVDCRPISQIDIDFDVAYAQISSGSSDRLQLQISEDCGTTWRTVWSSTGASLAAGSTFATSAFVPTSDDWHTFGVSNLPQNWLSGSWLFRFRFTSGNGNHLYLDNINISGTLADVPYLVYPLDGAAEMNENVVLNWQAVEDASEYEYALDVNSNFNSGSAITGITQAIDGSSDTTDTEFETTALTHGQQYYWRVRAKTGSSFGNWSETWSFTVASDGVGITESLDGVRWNVFPVPASERLYIECPEHQSNLSVLLYNSTGQIVLKLQGDAVPTMMLDVRGLPAGMYFLDITSADYRANRPILIIDNP